MDYENISKVLVTDGIVTVITKGITQPKRVYAVTNNPSNLSAGQIAQDIEAVKVMHRNKSGFTISTVHGELQMEEVLQFKWPAEDAKWTRGLIREIGDCELTIEDDLGEVQKRIVTGNDLGTRAWHNERLREEFSISSEIYYKLTDDDRIGAIRHPRPKMAQFGLDVLAWKGVGQDIIIDLVSPEVTMFRREEINLERTGNGWEVTTRSTIDNADILEFTVHDGIMSFASEASEMAMGADHLIYWKGVFPETVRVSMSGQLLSKYVDLPFPHHDPLIGDVECSPGADGSTFFNLDVTLRDVFRA